jgi:hypothetical protein
VCLQLHGAVAIFIGDSESFAVVLNIVIETMRDVHGADPFQHRTGATKAGYHLSQQFKCDLSLVGPRPLSILHYERDRAQGNVTRLLIKGGLLGLGHVNKGTPEMGNPIYEYEYVDQYLKRSSIGLLWLDLQIIGRGILLILKGGGH